MSANARELARAAGFGAVALAFAVTQPLVLIGLPLAVLLVAYGPHDARSAIIVGVLLATAALGDRVGLWWFERGWPMLLGGAFVWSLSLRSDWSFTTRALTAIGVSTLVAAVVFLLSPGAWLDLDTLMASRASQAATSMASLLGARADDTLRELLVQVTRLQVLLFPALLGVSSLGALGLGVSVRSWLAGDAGGAFDRLRSFRFSDHLVWVWLLGLVLLLAPVGDIAERVGGNAVFFMGALYVLRGLAVLLSVVGGVPWALGVAGAIILLLLAPLLILVLTVALIVGLGDTWLDVRGRLRRRPGTG